MRFVFILLLCSVFFPLNAQKIKGRIVDSRTHKAIPFANIRFNNSNNGTHSDMDGKFEIKKSIGIKMLKISSIGYNDTTIYISKALPQYLNISLKEEVTRLQEVTILPGINPAHRIIHNAVSNREINQPENLKSFTYTSYHKMVFKPQRSKMKDSLAPNDSLGQNLKKFIADKNLFLMETATKRYYQKGKNYEKVIANRVSGLKDAGFFMLATQFQSFSFYDPFIELMGEKYVNPISKNSTKHYLFILQDTLFQGIDTVFEITFRPLKGQNFKGLKGRISINSSGYAVQNVVAEPYEQNMNLKIMIQQNYARIQNYWFPIQLNTSIVFSTIKINEAPLEGVGKSYLDSIQINVDIPKRIFNSNVVMEVDKHASEGFSKDSISYRREALTERDQRTYSFIDSLGKAEHIDRKLKTFSILARGEIPIWKFSIPLKTLLNYNVYQGYKWGLGLNTNEKLSPFFKLTSSFSYTTKNKAFQYNLGADIHPILNRDFNVSAFFKDDYLESGKLYAFGGNSAWLNANYRPFFVQDFTQYRGFGAKVKFRAFQYFLWNLGWEKYHITSLNQYRYTVSESDGVKVSKSDFYLNEMKMGLRLAWGEKLLRTTKSQFSMGTKAPIFEFMIKYSNKDFYSDFNYLKYEAKISKDMNFKYLGKSTLVLKGGLLQGEAPYVLLFNGSGNYSSFNIFSPESFSTMRMGEFFSDRFAALFWTHNFGRIWSKNKYFNPEIAISNNMEIGQISNSQKHENILLQGMEKGYFESGILIHNILHSSISSLGLGFFYRYGAYSFPQWKENLAINMLIKFNLN